MGKITHAGEQEILRTQLLHQPQLIGKKLRLFKVVDHVKPADIVSGIAVAAPDVTADHEIHILNTILNADSHRCCLLLLPNLTFCRRRDFAKAIPGIGRDINGCLHNV